MSINFAACKKDPTDNIYKDIAQGFNISNGYGYMLLEMVGLPVEAVGSVAYKDIPALLQAIIKALNNRHIRAPMVTETSITGSNHGPTVVFCGRTDLDVFEYLTSLKEVAMTAMEYGGVIFWS